MGVPVMPLNPVGNDYHGATKSGDLDHDRRGHGIASPASRESIVNYLTWGANPLQGNRQVRVKTDA